MIGIGICLREVGHHGADLTSGLRRRGAWREAAHDRVAARGALVEVVGARQQHRRQRRRQPQVEVEADDRALEALRRDADDRQGHAVHAHGPADDIGRGGEPRLPERVGDHRHRRSAASRGVVDAERASLRHAHAERGEEVAGHQLREHSLRVPGLADGDRGVAPRADAGDGPQPLAQVAVLGPRHAGIGAGLAPWLDQLQPGDVDTRHRRQDQVVDPREHRGVHADARRQRQDGDDRQARPARQAAPRVPQILPGRPHVSARAARAARA